MSHKVKCRVCGIQFDTDTLNKEDWLMPSKNFYYHARCYNDWKVNSNHSDEEWIDLIYDFIARDLKVSYDFHMCEAQRKKYLSQNKYTNKGIYFSLKYFYELKKGDWSKGNGGIGIIPFIYKEATEYWTQLELKKQGTMSAIEKQIKEKLNRPTQTLAKKVNKKKNKWNLEDL